MLVARARLLRIALAGCVVVPGVPGVIGCGGESARDAGPVRCPIGDLSAPPEIEIVHLDATNTMFKTQAMDRVPLQAPPQGGWIVLLGARARNIDGCRVALKTVLVDACTNAVIKLDDRPTLLEIGSDGWGTSSLTTFGNLPVCPQATATRDLHDVPYVVTVILEDADGKRAEAQRTIVPTCPPSTPLCNCQCARDYVIGSECGTTTTDAGVPGSCIDAGVNATLP